MASNQTNSAPVIGPVAAAAAVIEELGVCDADAAAPVSEVVGVVVPPHPLTTRASMVAATKWAPDRLDIDSTVMPFDCRMY